MLDMAFAALGLAAAVARTGLSCPPSSGFQSFRIPLERGCRGLLFGLSRRHIHDESDLLFRGRKLDIEAIHPEENAGYSPGDALVTILKCVMPRKRNEIRRGHLEGKRIEVLPPIGGLRRIHRGLKESLIDDPVLSPTKAQDLLMQEQHLIQRQEKRV